MSKLMFDGNLPEHCYDCPIHDPGNGRCQIDGRTSDYRPFWCPLTVVTPDCDTDMPLTAPDEQKHPTCTKEPVKLTHDGAVIRADAIDALFRKAHTKPAVREDDGIHRYLDCYEAMDVIKALPSAVVEPTAREFLADWAVVCHHYDKVPCEKCPLYGICGPAMNQYIGDAISSVKSALRLVQNKSTTKDSNS